jgi:hypothetical protein
VGLQGKDDPGRMDVVEPWVQELQLEPIDKLGPSMYMAEP